MAVSLSDNLYLPAQEVTWSSKDGVVAGAEVVAVVGVVAGAEVVPGADIWSSDSYGEVGALAGAMPGVS